MSKNNQESAVVKRIFAGALVDRDLPLSRRGNEVQIHRYPTSEYGASFVILLEPDTRFIEVLDSEVADFCVSLEKLLSQGHSVIPIKLAISGSIMISRSTVMANDPERVFDLRVHHWKDIGMTRMYESTLEQIRSTMTDYLQDMPSALAS